MYQYPHFVMHTNKCYGVEIILTYSGTDLKYGKFEKKGKENLAIPQESLLYICFHSFLHRMVVLLYILKAQGFGVALKCP